MADALAAYVGALVEQSLNRWCLPESTTVDIDAQPVCLVGGKAIPVRFASRHQLECVRNAIDGVAHDILSESPGTRGACTRRWEVDLTFAALIRYAPR